MKFSFISNAFKIFRAEQVAEGAIKGKQAQIAINAIGTMLAGLLLFLKGTKYDPHIDDATLAYLAGGLYAIANWLLTAGTTSKVGVTGRAAPSPAIPSASAPVPPVSAPDPASEGDMRAGA